MPITTTNLETVINAKVVAASSSTENKDLLLLSKSIEALDASLTLKSTDIDVTIQAYDADISKTDVAETRSASIDMADNVLQQVEIKDYSESVNEASGNTLNIAQGNVFTKSISSNIGLLVFTNPPVSGKAGAFTFICTMSGTPAITWPSTVKWSGGTDPTLSTSGVDIFTFLTTDGGTNWYGFVSGQEMS
jgi:hypothetical protein